MLFSRCIIASLNHHDNHLMGINKTHTIRHYSLLLLLLITTTSEGDDDLYSTRFYFNLHLNMSTTIAHQTLCKADTNEMEIIATFNIHSLCEHRNHKKGD